MNLHTPVTLKLLPAILRRIWVQVLALITLLGGHVAVEFLPSLKEHASVARAISFLAVWVVAWAISRSLSVLKESPHIAKNLAPDLRSVIFTLLRVVLFSLSFLIALDTLGVSITPLIASLGVGSIAIGLALQDTLGNLFSGAYLYLDRPVAVGDWVRLEGGLEGQITRIGWRTTRLTVADNTVVIPNSKLSSSILTNLSHPTPETTVTVALGVGYDSDLERVEAVLMAAGREIMRAHTGHLSEREPVVRFLGFGDSAIQVNVTVRVPTFTEIVSTRHRLIKAIKTHFEREKIEIPFPQRVVRTLSA